MELAARLHCSYKRATFVLCAGNLVVALYLLQSVVGPFYFQTSSSSSSSSSNELQQQGLIPTLSPFSFSHLLSFHPFSFPFLFFFVFFFFGGILSCLLSTFLLLLHASSQSVLDLFSDSTAFGQHFHDLFFPTFFAPLKDPLQCQGLQIILVSGLIKSVCSIDFWLMCPCAALQANVIPKPDGMALHYIDWDEDDEVGTGDRTAVAEALQQEVIYSEEDLKRQEESNDLRRAVLPVRLMERVSNKWAFAP